MTKLLILAAATLALGACNQGETAPPAASNDNVANITALDEANMAGDANITDVPADDGDAPRDTETNAK